MGLITKEIDVCIVSNNYKHYEDLGYCIPKEINKNDTINIIYYD